MTASEGGSESGAEDIYIELEMAATGWLVLVRIHANRACPESETSFFSLWSWPFNVAVLVPGKVVVVSSSGMVGSSVGK